ncbi:MFS transporter [Chloroflexota bacterium]
MTQPSSDRRSRTKSTYAYYLAFIGLGLVTAVLGPALPALAELTQTSFSQISLLFTARALGYLLGSLIGGRLIDRLAGHRVMAAALVGLGVTLLLTPNNSLLWVLSVVIGFTGLFQGIVDVGGNTLIVWVHGDQVGPYMNGLHMFYGIGTFLAPIIIAQAALVSGSVAWGFWTIAVIVGLSAAQLFFIPSRPIPEVKPDDYSKRTNLYIVFLAATFLFCYSSMANIFGGWIYSYVVSLKLASETQAAYLTSTFWGVFTLGRLISIPIAFRSKPGAILLADLLGCTLSLGLILSSPTSITLIWIGSAGLGLSAASLFPTTVTLVKQRTEITGKVSSRFVLGSALGAMIPPWLVGQLFESIGPQIVILSVLVPLLVAFPVFAALYYQTKPREKLQSL